MIPHHHYTSVERALIVHQLADKREHYPPVDVHCDRHLCISTSANGVTTIFRPFKVKGVWKFKAIAAYA